MTDIIRDSVFGFFINKLSRHKFLPYTEERPDFIIPERYLVNSAPLQNLNEKQKDNGQNETSVFHFQSSSIIDSSYLTSNIEIFTNVHGTEGSLPQSTPETRYIMAEWYSETDPDNPKNWSTFKKVSFITVLSFLSIVVYLGSSTYTPGIPHMMIDLNTTRVMAYLPLTLFIIGYGLGPMVFSPLSEHPPLGRCGIYVGTLAIFSVLQIPTALVDTIEKICGLRLVAGIFASPALSTGGATVTDLLYPKNAFIGLVLWGAANFFGPTLGPFFGGILVQLANWRWTFWFLAIVGGFTTLLLASIFPETNSATILHRRAVRLRKLTGNNLIRSTYEIASEAKAVSRKEFVKETLWRPCYIAISEPMVFCLNFYIAFCYVIINSWFEAFPIVFKGIYDFNLIEVGLAYLPAVMGAFAGAGVYIWLLSILLRPKDAAIEKCLVPLMLSAICTPIALTIFSWCASPRTHWIAPEVGAFLFCFGAIMIFHSSFCYYARAYPRYLASVMAGCNLVRSWGAGVFPLFVSPMYNNLAIKDFPVGPGGSILIGVSVLLIPIPFVFYKYGAKLRGNSVYAN